jgi:hypothetical protein
MTEPYDDVDDVCHNFIRFPVGNPSDADVYGAIKYLMAEDAALVRANGDDE